MSTDSITKTPTVRPQGNGTVAKTASPAVRMQKFREFVLVNGAQFQPDIDMCWFMHRGGPITGLTFETFAVDPALKEHGSMVDDQTWETKSNPNPTADTVITVCRLKPDRIYLSCPVEHGRTIEQACQLMADLFHRHFTDWD